jgi:thioredoxin 1
MTETQLVELNDANFKETVASGITLVDFWAQWCRPCLAMIPVLERIAEKMSDKVKICKLNIDENPGISIEYNIMSIPAIFLFKDGAVVNRILGISSETELLAAIQAVEQTREE